MQCMTCMHKSENYAQIKTRGKEKKQLRNEDSAWRTPPNKPKDVILGLVFFCALVTKES